MTAQQLTVSEAMPSFRDILVRLGAVASGVGEASDSVGTDSEQRRENLLIAKKKEGEESLAGLSASVDDFAARLENVFNSSVRDEVEVDVSEMVRQTEIALLGRLANARELDELRPVTELQTELQKVVRGTIDGAVEQMVRLLRIGVVYYPATLHLLTPEVRSLVMTSRIPWWAHLQSMWNLFWSAIRHPLSETTIDLSTGRVLYRT
jgi:hypothetical protein